MKKDSEIITGVKFKAKLFGYHLISLAMLVLSYTPFGYIVESFNFIYIYLGPESLKS